MKKEQKWFTLVELMVGITISSLLMIGVSVLVSNGIQNITGQREIIKNSKSENNFYLDIIQKINAGEKNQFKKTGSGFLMKQKKDFSKGWFSYIGTKYLTGAYCTSTGSDFQNLNHVIIKDFIPFEWEGSNYFNDIAYNNSWVITYYNQAKVEISWTMYTWSLIWPTWVFSTGSNTYIVDTKGHTVYKYDSSTWAIIIGKWVPGKSKIDSLWTNALNVYLNNPTGIAEASGGIFIADALNDRILRYETSSQKVYEYLSKKDWLSEPTGLYYDSGANKLYISNAWKWEVLVVSATGNFSNTYNISFTPNTWSTIDNIQVSFFSWSLSSPVTITSPTNTGSISFSWIIQGEDYVWVGSSLRYFFTNYTSLPSSQPSCPWAGQYILSWTIPIRCTMNGTWILWTMQTKNLTSWNFDIEISNLSWSFLSNGTYFSKLELFSWNTPIWSKYHPFYTSWDNDINTIEDNTIEKISIWLSYPTGIYKNASNEIVINDFFTRWNYIFQTDWTFLSTWSLSSFDFNTLPLSFEDTIFKNPIESFDVIENVNLLTFKGKYYNNFSCIDGVKKGAADFLFKKNLK